MYFSIQQLPCLWRLLITLTVIVPKNASVYAKYSHPMSLFVEKGENSPLVNIVGGDGSTTSSRIFDNDNNKGDNKLVLNPEAKKTLGKLEAPIYVISAIGAARVGKSFWLGKLAKEHGFTGDLFKVSDESAACTNGAWFVAVKMPESGGNLLFVDLEGIDKGSTGDQLRTDQLSVIASQFSSKILFFMKEHIESSRLTFYDRILHFNELLSQGSGAIPSTDRNRIIENTHYVLRNGMKLPKKYKNREEEFQDVLGSTRFQQGKSRVFEIPHLQISDGVSDSTSSKGDDVHIWTRKFREFVLGRHSKKNNHHTSMLLDTATTDSIRPLTLPNGTPIDGPALVSLMQDIHTRLEMDDVKSFIDSFHNVGKQICDNRWVSLMSDLGRKSLDEMGTDYESFQNRCKDPEILRKAEAEVQEEKNIREEKRRHEEEFRLEKEKLEREKEEEKRRHEEEFRREREKQQIEKERETRRYEEEFRREKEKLEREKEEEKRRHDEEFRRERENRKGFEEEFRREVRQELQKPREVYESPIANNPFGLTWSDLMKGAGTLGVLKWFGLITFAR